MILKAIYSNEYHYNSLIDYQESLYNYFVLFSMIDIIETFCACEKKTLMFGISVHLQNSANETDSHILYHYTTCINLNFRK